MNAKIQMLPGQATTPEVFVATLMDQAHLIKHIACVIEWNDEGGARTNTAHTHMTCNERAWMKAVFKVFTEDQK